MPVRCIKEAGTIPRGSRNKRTTSYRPVLLPRQGGVEGEAVLDPRQVPLLLISPCCPGAVGRGLTPLLLCPPSAAVLLLVRWIVAAPPPALLRTPRRLLHLSESGCVRVAWYAFRRRSDGQRAGRVGTSFAREHRGRICLQYFLKWDTAVHF